VAASVDALSFVVAVPLPLGPVLPELPVVDTGLASDVELDAPVLPVFVLDDCALTVPLSPLNACAESSSLELPPSPPSAEVLAIASPPLTLPIVKWLRLPTRTRARRSPAAPDLARTLLPPSLPNPPRARPATTLTAGPVVPDVPSALD